MMVQACVDRAQNSVPLTVNEAQEMIVTQPEESSITQKTYPMVHEDDIVVAITDRTQLQDLEQDFGLEHLLPHRNTVPFPTDRISTRWLFQNHLGYQKIARHLHLTMENSKVSNFA